MDDDCDGDKNKMFIHDQKLYFDMRRFVKNAQRQRRTEGWGERRDQGERRRKKKKEKGKQREGEAKRRREEET